MQNKKDRMIIYKCSNPLRSFEDFLKVNNDLVKMGDTCFICNEGVLLGDKYDTELDPVQYPTLAKYEPRVIWNIVLNLQNRYPDMEIDQYLLNLEMDIEQQGLQKKVIE